MDLDLSDRKYNILRKTVNELYENCFPSLYALRKEKQKVIPNITTTEISAEVDIKSIMQRTSAAILKLCKLDENPTKVTLVCKWGMDGSSGHSRYKQKFSNEESNDEFMFFIAFVPLK